MSWVAHFLDTNNLIQLNQDVLTKVERIYGQYPFTVMWSSLPYSAYHFSDNVKHILKYPRPTFPIWVVSRKTWLHYLKNDRKSCGLITVKWVLNWMSPNILSPPYFIDCLLFRKQNQNCKYFRYSWRPNYINNSCHWVFHKTTSTVPDTCMNLVLNVYCFQSSTPGTFTFWWAES